MMSFDTLFPRSRRRQVPDSRPYGNPHLPDATFLLREYYCAEADCDCRRTLLQIWWTERHEIAATLNYSFEPATPPSEDEPQIFVDPINPQSDLSSALCELVERMIADDWSYRIG